MKLNINIFLGLVLLQFSTEIEARTCKPLQKHQNVKLHCLESVKNPKYKNVTDCSLPQESGSIVYYKCETYYTPFDSKSIVQGKLYCDDNGMWQGYKKYTSFRCKEDCGNPVLNSEPLVINGIQTNRSDHPWNTMLFFRSQKLGWTYLCGGSIIRNQVILTAAHCIAATNKNINDPKLYRVVLGGVSTKFSENTPSIGSQIHSVKRMYVSENYDPRRDYQADIAILQLEDPIEYTDYISPVCLPNDYSVDVNVIRNGVQGEVAGFGITEDGTAPNTLRVIKLSVKSKAECYNSHRRVLSDSQFCAGSKSDQIWQTVCNGDSGNGITFPSIVHEKFFVHGIVSSGDADARKGICQNSAVFTRVYPFVFWVRDIIEEITGETARDLNSNVPYPYVFAGSETQLKVYTGLPREWENRITKLEIRYAYLNLNEAVHSLEYAKPITSINFNSIILNTPGGTNQRVVLPLLNYFTLDNSAPQMKIDRNRTFPNSVTASFLKKYFFFDKDYDNRNWALPSLLSLKMDVKIVLSIFRIFHLNNAKGEIFLNSPEFTAELFDNFKDNTEFELKNLALHKTKFDISQISTASTLALLTLTKVKLIGKTDFTQSLRSFPKLKTLILDLVSDPQVPSNTLSIDDLPINLEHLTLFDSMKLAPPNVKELYSSQFQIIFPDQLKNRNIQRNTHTSAMMSLKTFCCNFCKVETEIWSNFPNTFPNLTVLMLRTDETVDVQNLLSSPTLKYLHLESSTRMNLSNFLNMEAFYPNLGQRNVVRLERTASSNWKNVDITIVDIQRGLFACSGGIYFWTSEEEYRSRYRLYTFEKEAYDSGNYKFDGGDTKRKVEFNGIPVQIQPKLTSIILNNVQVTPKILSTSIMECKNLKTVTLLNVSVVGHGKRYSFDTQNLTFDIQSERIGDFDLEYVNVTSYGKWISSIIPLQHIGRFNVSGVYSNVLSRLFQNVNSARLQESDATIFAFDSSQGELRNLSDHFEVLAMQLPESHFLNKYLVKNLINPRRGYGDIIPPEWEYSGLQIINKASLQPFYSDSYTKLMGRLGIFKFLLNRYGKHLTLSSLSLSALENQTNSFPPVQAIALSLIKDSIVV